MLSSALRRSRRPRSRSAMAPLLTRIMPRSILLRSWSSTARLSWRSLIRPWETRKWPRYSSGLFEAEERISPSLKKIFFSIRPWTISRVPLFLLCESHCNSSSSCMVLRLPTIPMVRCRLIIVLCEYEGRRARNGPAAGGTGGRERASSPGRGGPPLTLVVARGAGIAVGDVRRRLHGDEDELRDAPPSLEEKGLGAEVL